MGAVLPINTDTRNRLHLLSDRQRTIRGLKEIATQRNKKKAQEANRQASLEKARAQNQDFQSGFMFPPTPSPASTWSQEEMDFELSSLGRGRLAEAQPPPITPVSPTPTATPIQRPPYGAGRRPAAQQPSMFQSPVDVDPLGQALADQQPPSLFPTTSPTPSVGDQPTSIFSQVPPNFEPDIPIQFPGISPEEAQDPGGFHRTLQSQGIPEGPLDAEQVVAQIVPSIISIAKKELAPYKGAIGFIDDEVLGRMDAWTEGIYFVLKERIHPGTVRPWTLFERVAGLLEITLFDDPARRELIDNMTGLLQIMSTDDAARRELTERFRERPLLHQIAISVVTDPGVFGLLGVITKKLGRHVPKAIQAVPLLRPMGVAQARMTPYSSEPFEELDNIRKGIYSTINAWKARNGTNARNKLQPLRDKDVDVSAVDDAIDEYDNVLRSDYTGADGALEFSEARTEAWDDILSQLDELDVDPDDLLREPGLFKPPVPGAAVPEGVPVSAAPDDITKKGLFEPIPKWTAQDPVTTTTRQPLEEAKAAATAGRLDIDDEAIIKNVRDAVAAGKISKQQAHQILEEAFERAKVVADEGVRQMDERTAAEIKNVRDAVAAGKISKQQAHQKGVAALARAKVAADEGQALVRQAEAGTRLSQAQLDEINQVMDAIKANASVPTEVKEGLLTRIRNLFRGRVGKDGKPPPSPTAPPSQEDSALYSRFLEYLRQASRLSDDKALLQSAERSRRAAIVAKTLTPGSGTEGFLKARGGLSGPLTPDISLPPSPFTAEDTNRLFDVINTSSLPDFTNRPMSRYTATSALWKTMVDGKIPAKAEIDWLRKVFNHATPGMGDEVADTLSKFRGRREQAWQLFLETANIPRTIQASFDLSALLRQGLLFGPTHPKEYTEAVRTMTRSILSEGNAQAAEMVLRNDPIISDGISRGLFIADRTGGLNAREELFISRLLNDIPVLKQTIGVGVRLSERAFVTLMNALRGNTYKTLAKNLTAGGQTDQLDNLARYINVLSGRASLGPLEKFAGLLNPLFFAPRFALSRLQLPLMPIFQAGKLRRGDINILVPRTLRAMMMRDLVLFSSSAAAVGALVKWSGAGDVNLDPRSSDFGKIKIGPARLDPWAGFIQVARYIAQGATRSRKTLGSGEVIHQSIDETLWRWIRSKLAPGPGLVTDLISEETFMGDDFSFEPTFLGNQARERLLPFFFQDLWEAIDEEGASGIPLALPGFFGVGIQTFSTVHDVSNRIAATKHQDLVAQYGSDLMNATDSLGRPVLSLDEKRAIRNSEEVQKAVSQVKPTDVSDRDKFSVLFDSWHDKDKKLQNQLALQIRAGRSGAELRQSISDFKQNRHTAADTLFHGVFKDEPQHQLDALRELYWSAPLIEDLESGYVDYRARKIVRDGILTRARAIGISESDIKARVPYDNKRVEEAVQQYESDLDLARPYFDLAWDLHASLTGADAELWANYLTASKQDRALMRNEEPDIAFYNSELTTNKKFYREDHPEVELVLLRQGFITSPMTSEGEAFLEESRQEAILSR